MKSRKHAGKVLNKKDGFSVIECTSCGFKHIDPLPSEKELERLYKREFYSKEKPDYFKYAEEDAEWWTARYNYYYNLLETHTKGRRLLDIGSGPGYFLDVGKGRGWEVLGFEPSRAAVHYTTRRSLTTVNDFFSAKKAAPHGPFDAIMISLVLEHVSDPTRFIEEAKQVLAPGGLLCVIVPNDYNPLQKLLVECHNFARWWVVPKHHLNYFTIASITKLIKSCGLTPVETETSFPMEFFLLSGRNYVKSKTIGLACHKERKILELSFFAGNTALLQNMYRSWAKVGIGREVLIVAQKEG